MKFHIIENDYIKEYQKEKYNTKLKLVTNDIDYSDIDDSGLAEEAMLKEIKNIKITTQQIDYIVSYINERIARKQGKKVAKLMINSIEKLEYKEGKNMLEAFVDRFLDMADEKEKKGEKRGEKRGISEGISQVAINMLKQKCKKDLIKQYTGLSDEKIKELEKTLQSA